MVSISLRRSRRVEITYLPTSGIDFKRLAGQQEIELNTSAFLVTHTCEQSPILIVYESNRNRSEDMQKTEERDDCTYGQNTQRSDRVRFWSRFRTRTETRHWHVPRLPLEGSTRLRLGPRWHGEPTQKKPER
jgi:hypothetical protein